MQHLGEGLRKRKQASKVLRELDAFPKVPESYQEQSTSGGTVSLFTFLFIGILVLSEFFYYRHTEMKYGYEVDRDADSKIHINLDLTVAMHCEAIGADVLDLSGTSLDTTRSVVLEPTYFAMSKKQASWWRAFQAMQEGNSYRSLNDVPEIVSYEEEEVGRGEAAPTYMPVRDDAEFEGKDFDACRIFGNLAVNKVAGNFHVTAGKSIPHPRGHAHLSALIDESSYNFSHRIDLLSFGEATPGIINPLDGDMAVASERRMMYQYYIKIVPTEIKTFKRQIATHQYSVTQQERNINHLTGSHGVPGIFFKYDLSPIMVSVREQRRSLWQFMIRLCGIVGGIFATSGMLHFYVGSLISSVIGSARKAPLSPPAQQVSPATSQLVPGVGDQVINSGTPLLIAAASPEPTQQVT